MRGHFLTHQALDIADHLHTYPVIVSRRCAVTDFADGSLSITPFCYMTFNPDIPQTNDMRAWFNENKTMIMDFATPGKSPNKLAGYRRMEDGTSDALTLTADNTTCVQIQGKMSVVDLQQDINYCECKTCYKTIMKEANEEFSCRTCSAKKKQFPKSDTANDNSTTDKRISRQLPDTPEKSKTKRLRSEKNTMATKQVIQASETAQSLVNPVLLRKIKQEKGTKK